MKARTKERRRDELESLQQDICAEFARSRIGSEEWVLIDREDPESPGSYLGRTTREAPDVDPVVFVSPPDAGLPPLAPGQLRKCRVTGSSVYDLDAIPI